MLFDITLDLDMSSWKVSLRTNPKPFRRKTYRKVEILSKTY